MALAQKVDGFAMRGNFAKASRDEIVERACDEGVPIFTTCAEEAKTNTNDSTINKNNTESIVDNTSIPATTVNRLTMVNASSHITLIR